ncbi:hypothetical protein BDV96DRAFT_394493 [Lophiotrema nucula]|uniref:Uncharacterized protein n=1 Tax=Lophiotrema nucula TaxID=690887 RepID=A0A6A5ZGN5_9PLEO|nr:hypothetical protein BDV96DRAFT_394493 [Lophiotrema nucula]
MCLFDVHFLPNHSILEKIKPGIARVRLGTTSLNRSLQGHIWRLPIEPIGRCNGPDGGDTARALWLCGPGASARCGLCPPEACDGRPPLLSSPPAPRTNEGPVAVPEAVRFSCALPLRAKFFGPMMRLCILPQIQDHTLAGASRFRPSIRRHRATLVWIVEIMPGTLSPHSRGEHAASACFCHPRSWASHEWELCSSPMFWSPEAPQKPP